VIILDTNVVSELMKPSPDAAVQTWVRARSGGALSTTSITLPEIRYGIQRLPDGRRKELLRVTAEDVFAAFEDQILPFDAAAARQYALIVTAGDVAGRPIDGFDAQIAAICRSRGGALGTRNLKDFQDTGIDVVDPWSAR